MNELKKLLLNKCREKGFHFPGKDLQEILIYLKDKHPQLNERTKINYTMYDVLSFDIKTKHQLYPKIKPGLKAKLCRIFGDLFNNEMLYAKGFDMCFFLYTEKHNLEPVVFSIRNEAMQTGGFLLKLQYFYYRAEDIFYLKEPEIVIGE